MEAAVDAAYAAKTTVPHQAGLFEITADERKLQTTQQLQTWLARYRTVRRRTTAGVAHQPITTFFKLLN